MKRTEGFVRIYKIPLILDEMLFLRWKRSANLSFVDVLVIVKELNFY